MKWWNFNSFIFKILITLKAMNFLAYKINISLKVKKKALIVVSSFRMHNKLLKLNFFWYLCIKIRFEMQLLTWI